MFYGVGRFKTNHIPRRRISWPSVYWHNSW